MVILGAVLLLHNLDIRIFRYVWPSAIILLGLYLLVRSLRRRTGTVHIDFGNAQVFGETVSSGFTGAVDGTTMSHFIGDIELNLTGAQLKPGVNKVTLSAFIGDIKVMIPKGVAAKVVCSAFAGSFHALGQTKEGIMLSLHEATADYETAEKKLLITCSAFIGEIKIGAA